MLVEVLFAMVMNDAVSFKEVQPIFQQRCAQCHYEARWNWTNYETAVKNKTKIYNRVWVLKDMPIIRNNMKDSERLLIKKWIDTGVQK